MKKLVTIIVLFHFSHTNAQTLFNFQYDLEYHQNTLTSVLPTDEYFYVTGIITDTVGQSFRVGILFLKLIMDGGILKEKKIVSDSVGYLPWRGDLIFDSEGNLFDVGYMIDTAQHAFLVKFTPEGDTVFTRVYDNPFFPNDDFIVTASLKRKENGNMYLLCGINNNPNGVNPDIYLIEIDKEGNVLNSHVYGHSAIKETPYSLLVDNDGGAIIGANKTNEDIFGNNFYSRTYIFKVNEEGQFQWGYETPNSQLFDIARDMVKTPDGGLVVATGKGIEHQINSTSSELRWHSYLFKLNSNHEKEWGIELRGTRPSPTTGFIKVVEATDGSGYVATGNLGEDVSIGDEVYGSWVVKVSAQGDSLWARYYSYFDGIDSQPRPKDFMTTPSGGYVIVGETKPHYPDGQGQRAWVMTLDEHGCLIPGCEENDTVISTINLPVDSPIKLAVHPNPTSNYLNFQLRANRPVTSASFRIIDSNGRVVREIRSRMPKETHIVSVDDWSPGGYFLQYVEKGRVIHTEKFIILNK